MIKKFFVIFISIIIALIISEVFLRIIGIEPWKYIKINDATSGENIFIEDKKLGWISSEGNYKVNPADTREKIFKLSIGKNGERKTGLERKKFNNEILIIGGSFVEGWGVNDDDTFAAKLEKKY